MSLISLLSSFHGASALRVFLLALFLSVPVAQARVFEFLYTHYANREPLAATLADFARTGGYRTDVSSELSGTVSGRFEKVAPVDFLRGMERAFGVRWYRLGETIHFYHAAEFRRTVLSAPTQGAKKLAAQLENSGLVSQQLPLGIPPDAAGFLTVSGPEDYVRTLENLAAIIERAGDSRTMRVFRLKYASADDLTIESMGRSVTVPGVATLLRAMVLGEYAPSSGGTAAGVTVKAEKATLEKLKGSGLAARGGNATAPAPAATASAAIGISIVADPRVNAVVVQDTQSRMAYYEQVIADLDKETHLIEIHAAIVDIDSDHTSELGLRFGGRHMRDSGWSAGGEFSTATGGDGQNGGFALTPDASGSFAEAGGILSTIYTHGNNFFVARVQALEKNGNARVLGRPSVLTTDNLEATLENITTYYVSVRGQEEVDLFKVEAGTVLRVTPHIIENAQGEPSIRLAVTVQDDQENSSAMSGDMAIPPIKQTKINTQAIVDAGQSLLIGGYYFEEKRAGEDGVPGLMHIPLIGRLFKTTTENTRQMERLVLITPRILRLGEVNAPPPQIGDADFRRAPGQDHYAPRPDARAVPEDTAAP